MSKVVEEPGSPSRERAGTANPQAGAETLFIETDWIARICSMNESYVCRLESGPSDPVLKGSGTQYLFRFVAIVASKIGTRDEDQYTRRFAVCTEVTYTVANTSPYRTLSRADQAKVLFAYTQEQLERDGVPGEGATPPVYQINATLDPRFDGRCPYTLKNVDIENSFTIPGNPVSRIGFLNE